MDSQNLWGCGLISLKTFLIFPKHFLNFRFHIIEEQSIINLSINCSKCYTFVVLNDSKVTFFGEGEDAAFFTHFSMDSVAYLKYVIKFPCLSGSISSWSAAFLLFIFVNTILSSSSVNCPCLISTWLLIIFVIGLSLTLRKFPSKFLKCFFYYCIIPSWLATFSFTLEVLFLPLTSFIVCHANYDYLSSTKFLVFWFGLICSLVVFLDMC